MDRRKKCKPINFCGFINLEARIEIGIVDVLDAKNPLGFIYFSAVLSALI